MSKNILPNIDQLLGPNLFQDQKYLFIEIKNAYNLLKLGTFDISNIPISILTSKIIFIKYCYQISIFIKFQ